MSVQLVASQILNSSVIKKYAESKIRDNNLMELGDNFTMTIDDTAHTLTVVSGDVTQVFNLRSDLNICPKTLYDYYLYRFTSGAVVAGDAIYIVVPDSSETVHDGSTTNALVSAFNAKQLSYFEIVSRGPMPRQLTAREVYYASYTIYKYTI